MYQRHSLDAEVWMSHRDVVERVPEGFHIAGLHQHLRNCRDGRSGRHRLSRAVSRKWSIRDAGKEIHRNFVNGVARACGWDRAMHAACRARDSRVVGE